MAKLTVAIVLLGALAGLGVRPAFAHAFGERYDLPVPLSLFAAGAAATVALSFVVIGIFVQRRPGAFRYPRYNLLGPRWLRAVLTNRALLTVIKVCSVALLALVVATSLLGVNRPLDNLSPTLVWIIWWVGMGYVVALLGNLWMLVNPWEITYEWVEKLVSRGSRRRGDALYKYPKRWDVWPALALFFMFAWMENVYTSASKPFTLGLLVLLYSAITWCGMLAFGKHTWLKHGEAFSVLFGLFARFSSTEVRVSDNRPCRTCELECNLSDEGCVDCYACFERAQPHQRELNLRPYAVGLINTSRVSLATAAFVVLALATVTFDGLQETPTWSDVQVGFYRMTSGAVNAIEVTDTLGLVVLPVVFLAVFLGFSWAVRRLSGEQVPVSEVAKAFVFSLVPIALAYNMAHYLSLLVIQGQLIIPLASDPFGYGWDLFGTAGYRLNIGAINAKFAWFVAVIAIVLGHVVAVYVAHVVALQRVRDHTLALRSQYPMLALMVFYTATSLWIIAQPIVNEA